jgi:hypothetical protein
LACLTEDPGTESALVAPVAAYQKKNPPYLL